MTEKYICIHGHFYQPPRENPWLEYVELQDSAYPYHDWNDRVTQECYRQNAASRILGPDRRIIDIVNNYEDISFNFGPTLISWLAVHARDVYEKIIEADKLSIERFSGHGCAIAQVYNHMIIPLANERDKRTQIAWGIADFERHFNRRPEGLWLAETAVDTASLEALTEQGIKFTILAPRQAKKVRKTGSQKWAEVNENTLDTSVPYTCNLPGGKSITLFFYNGAVSQGVAYGGLLKNGENFANKIIAEFKRDDIPAALAHVAMDGESFGHHHKKGDMALAYCIHHIKTNNLANVTVYGEFLEKFPPQNEVEIWDNSSWSCVHGIERWKSNCGCSADPAKSGRQEWRQPLRHAMDWLRDNLITHYEQNMSRYNPDPWLVRDNYVNVIEDRSTENVNKFITQYAGGELNYGDRVTFIKLLEMQRHAMLMYTSCGWFFDNISGIENVQIMEYASRAIQLCCELTDTDYTNEFKNILQQAPAHDGQYANGREIFEKLVEPSRIDLNRVAAHFALCSTFEKDCHEVTPIFAYSATLQDQKRNEAGSQILSTARATIQSKVTLENHAIEFAGFYLGEHNLFAAVRPQGSDEQFFEMRDKIEQALREAQVNEVLHLMSSLFNNLDYTIKDLFKDQQRLILEKLLASTFDEIENSFRRIYEHHYSIMQMIRNMNMPLPKSLSGPTEFIINLDLCREIEDEDININRLTELVDEAKRLSLSLEYEKLAFETSKKVSSLMQQLQDKHTDIETLAKTERIVEVLKNLTPEMDLQNAQNIFFRLAKDQYKKHKAKAHTGDQNARQWLEHFHGLAAVLGLAVG